jgi:dihydrofolate reductase/thymidylate synthase
MFIKVSSNSPWQSKVREKFDIIVAADLNLGIGKNNALPWRISKDLKYFKDLTSSTPVPEVLNAVIMGRKTWESIPAAHRPLKGRINIVLTSNANYPMPEGHFISASLDQALEMLIPAPVDRVFIIGGAQVYNEAMQHPSCGLLYLTQVRHVFDCDTFLPPFKQVFQLLSCSEVESEDNLEFCFKVYEFNFPEYLMAE